ncbi:MAG: arginase, partial [Ferruginibacter sp.]
MKHFKFYSKEDILSMTKVRRFETRMGERLQFLKPEGEWPEVLQESTAKYVLLGIPEDFGVKANYGVGGTETAWLSFMTAFLNIQSNDFLTGENTLLLGHFDFGDIKFLIENNAYNPEEKINAYRHALNIIDEEVENLVKVIASAKKIPIIIGGGHNNA